MAQYSEMVCEKLKPEVRCKCRGLISTGVVLLHNTACSRTAVKTIDILQNMKFGVLEDPTHSPDLIPSDYHLFGPLKDALRSY